ncbi:MAG: hypothetical protein QM775_14830 [Pirellulales bacterium]
MSSPPLKVFDDSSPPQAAVRSRPAWLRALGHDDPPAEVTVDGIVHRRVEIFKHDSWAATGVYQSSEQAESSGARIICKFNRRQSLLGLPGDLGRPLAGTSRSRVP